MKHFITLLALLISAAPLLAQTWVDTLYQIQAETDISYGVAIDFAGNERNLLLDISYPTNDTAPECGRPLLVAIHGGAFITGKKDEGMAKRMREDFAKRGFTTASISYRLGQFPTNLQVHCNAQALGIEWDCLNMADTSEWYRAYYRGIQDANGAIRWLVNQSENYDIDPNNIFIVGESAGGYIAMGAGFIDNSSEVLTSLKGSMSAVLPPHNIYEVPCVQTYNYDTTIASMNLSRPDLGGYEGTLNYPAQKTYTIRGVGNFFGGVFNNIFGTQSGTPPALYLFHQPNDLIVPYNTNKVLAGFATCATQFPLNCAYIINRPTTKGSNAIVDMLVAMQNNSQTIPDYLFENTSNTADCFTQVSNPSLAGHAVDNYWLRTTNMASFFASKIETCETAGLNQISPDNQLKAYPNPVDAEGLLTIKGDFHQGDIITITNVVGKKVIEQEINSEGKRQEVRLKLNHPPGGVYYISIGKSTTKIIITE